MYENLKKNEMDTDPHTHEWYLNLEKKIRQLVSAGMNYFNNVYNYRAQYNLIINVALIKLV